MEPIIPPTDGRKCMARETLDSGRQVHIDQMVDALGKVTVVVRVGGDAGWVAKTLPIRSFLGFGRPLADRIRAAIIELDHPIEPEPPDEVMQAVEAALFYGGPLHEGMYSTHQDPPLIMRQPPIPPPPGTR